MSRIFSDKLREADSVAQPPAPPPRNGRAVALLVLGLAIAALAVAFAAQRMHATAAMPGLGSVAEPPLLGHRACKLHQEELPRLYPPTELPRPLLERGSLFDAADAKLFVPLLRKLRSGRPVSVLTVGSSVVGVHAGCTEPMPMLSGCVCPRCCGARCGFWGDGAGWALRVLQWINSRPVAVRSFLVFELAADREPSAALSRVSLARVRARAQTHNEAIEI